MDEHEYVYTFGMEDAESYDRLEAGDTGVLSLASGGSAYAIPLSYDFDGSRLLIRLADDGTTKKLDYLDSTTEATFVVYDRASTGESWSIVITGTLHEVTDELTPTELTDRFEPLRIFDEAIEDVDVRVYELRIADLAARTTGTTYSQQE